MLFRFVSKIHAQKIDTYILWGVPGGTTITLTFTYFHPISPHYAPLHMNYNALVLWSLLKRCADDTKKIDFFRDSWYSKNFPEPKIV